MERPSRRRPIASDRIRGKAGLLVTSITKRLVAGLAAAAEKEPARLFHPPAGAGGHLGRADQHQRPVLAAGDLQRPGRLRLAFGLTFGVVMAVAYVLERLFWAIVWALDKLFAPIIWVLDQIEPED